MTAAALLRPTAAPARPWWRTRAMFVAMVLAAAVPLLWPRVPPFTDVYGHIGHFSVMLDGADGPLSRFYRFDWQLMGNLGVDLVVYALAPLTGLEAAVKLVTIGIAMLTTAACLWLSREAHGETSPTALFALPLVYSHPFVFGFLNFSLSMGLALAGLALWLRLGRMGRTRLRAGVFLPLACLVWLTHTVGWGMLGLMAFGAELARERGAGRRPVAAMVRAGLACLPLCLPFALLLAWRGNGHAASGGTHGFFEMGLKGFWLLTVLRDRWAAWDIAGLGMLGALLYYGARSAHFGWSRPLAYGAALLALAFLVMPSWVFTSAYADMRLAPWPILLAVLALAPRASMPPRTVATIAAIGLAFALARLAGTTASTTLYAQDHERELQALDHVPQGARVASLVTFGCQGTMWSVARVDHLGSMVLARRQGFSNDQWLFPGYTLLDIRYAAAGAYLHDGSQFLTCNGQPGSWALPEALAALPRQAFDYLWLIKPPPGTPPRIAGMREVWRNGRSVLYRIDRP